MSSCPALPPVCPFLFGSSRFLYLVWFSFPPSVLEWVMLILKYIFKTVFQKQTPCFLKPQTLLVKQPIGQAAKSRLLMPIPSDRVSYTGDVSPSSDHGVRVSQQHLAVDSPLCVCRLLSLLSVVQRSRRSAGHVRHALLSSSSSAPTASLLLIPGKDLIEVVQTNPFTSFSKILFVFTQAGSSGPPVFVSQVA